MQTQVQGRKEGKAWQPEPAAGREGLKRVQRYQGESCRPSRGMFPQRKKGKTLLPTMHVVRNFADEDISISAVPQLCWGIQPFQVLRAQPNPCQIPVSLQEHGGAEVLW